MDGGLGPISQFVTLKILLEHRMQMGFASFLRAE
jgi:hypothetical protein